MVTHNDVMKHWLIRDDDGNVLSVNTEEAEPAKIVFAKGSVSPEWFNLLRASGMLYQQLSYQYEALQAFIDFCDASGTDAGVFIEMQNAILVTQRAAIEGVEKVGAAIDKEAKAS